MSGISVIIDLSSIATPIKFNANRTIELQEAILWEASNVFINNWRGQADRNLHKTRNLYKNSIGSPDVNKNISIIELFGALPNMIEDGASAFDMKEAFAKSAKKHQKKNGGWYLTVPFRWATPDAIGDNEAFSSKMPKGVYEEAKNLDESTDSGNGSKMVYGGKIDPRDLPKIYQGYGVRKEIKGDDGTVLYGAYQHKSNLYEGMVKIQKDYEKSSQNKYMTFRRVSNLSDPMSWIHPGFAAKNFAEAAIDETDFDFIAEQVVNSFISRIM